MNYDRKKEVDPFRTVQRAREILTNLGILTVETWKQAYRRDALEPHAFSVRLDAPDYGFGTNGKGSLRSFTLASAYGEFLERLENMILFPIGQIRDESFDAFGFTYFPDEEVCSEADVLHASDCFSETVYRDFYRNHFLLTCGEEERRKVLSAYRCFDMTNRKTEYVTWPFYSVRTNETVRIWNCFATYLHGSTGMCAGNTPAEALVQGLSEILERYALTQIFTRDIIPPDVPREVYDCYEPIAEAIREIEAMGNFKVLVKDCSIEKGLPVCAVVLVDRNKQRYRASFGCHPHLPVAIERCLTELLQGFDPTKPEESDMCLISADIPKDRMLPHLNVRNMQSNGMGILSHDFFTGAPSYPYTRLESMEHADNRAMLLYMTELALTLSDDVLIRDVSYLGFPAYFIIVPGVSHYPTTQSMLTVDEAYRSLADIGTYKENLTEQKLRKLLVGLNRFESTSAKNSVPFSPRRLKIAAMRMLGQYRELVSYLAPQTWQSESEGREMRALTDAVKYAANGCTEQEAKAYITLFYGEEWWQKLKETWLCPNPVAVELQGVEEKKTGEKTDAINELFVRVKKQFCEVRICQEELRELFPR